MCPLSQKASDHLQTAKQRFEERNPKSKQQHQIATESLPGGNTRSVLHADPFPVCMARGRGNRLSDIDGHEHLDCIGDMTAGLYGHSQPVLVETITSTIGNIGMNLGATTTTEAQFANAICQRFDSIERVARQHTGRSKVIVFGGAYHGGLLSFAHGVAANNVDKTDWIIGPYNDAQNARQLILENKHVAAAVLVEGMQGAGGCIPGTADFLHAVQDAARESGVIFILDEVMTSRLAQGGIQSVILHPMRGTPLSPDLTTLGKWIGGGLSIGAFGGRSDLMAVYDPRTSNVHHSGTFNNNTLAMNAGYKGMIAVYTPEACLALNSLGDQLRSDLMDLAQGTKMTITGVGAVMHVHFLSTGGRNGVFSIDDLATGADSVESVLRDLFWFYLTERGLWIARRGMISLILGTTAAEIERMRSAVSGFLVAFRELVVL
ncbi:pyridoxal phosphate-dependent transferase [Aspergillus karnatakaensis]|uniref:pyridoxal phosphate-dependent transferase n=1 Tax=Aspergillus karnatakaensis TaxID=1810916 RepID=UPI003CCE2F8C